MNDKNWNEIALKKAQNFCGFIDGKNINVKKDNIIAVSMNDKERGEVCKLYYVEKISDSENSVIIHDVLSGGNFSTIINYKEEELLFKKNIKRFEDADRNLSVDENSMSVVYGGLHEFYRGRFRSGSKNKFPEVCEKLSEVLENREDFVELDQLKEVATDIFDSNKTM